MKAFVDATIKSRYQAIVAGVDAVDQQLLWAAALFGRDLPAHLEARFALLQALRDDVGRAALARQARR